MLHFFIWVIAHFCLHRH